MSIKKNTLDRVNLILNDRTTEQAADLEKKIMEEIKPKVVKAERQRFATIMRSEHAQNRFHSAKTLALETNMTAQEVITMLQKLPLEKEKSKLDLVLDAIEAEKNTIIN